MLVEAPHERKTLPLPARAHGVIFRVSGLAMVLLRGCQIEEAIHVLHSMRWQILGLEIVVLIVEIAVEDDVVFDAR